MLAGKTLKTGAGELARMTIRPFILSSVFPISVRMPWVALKSPRIATIGIVRPTTASRVRVGRVIRFCQAKRIAFYSMKGSVDPPQVVEFRGFLRI